MDEPSLVSAILETPIPRQASHVARADIPLGQIRPGKVTGPGNLVPCADPSLHFFGNSHNLPRNTRSTPTKDQAAGGDDSPTSGDWMLLMHARVIMLGVLV